MGKFRSLIDAFARQRNLQLLLMIVVFQAYVLMVFWLPLRDWLQGGAEPVPAAHSFPEVSAQTRVVEIGLDSDFFTSQFTGGVAFTSTQSSNTPSASLRDHDEETIWCSGDTSDDTLICVTNAEPFLPIAFTLMLFRPAEGLRLAEFSVVATDLNVTNNATFEIISARATPFAPFTRSVTVPADLRDGVFVAVQLDPSDSSWKPHKAWGITCLSQTRGQRRHYAATKDQDICIREFMIHTSAFSMGKSPPPP